MRRETARVTLLFYEASVFGTMGLLSGELRQCFVKLGFSAVYTHTRITAAFYYPFYRSGRQSAFGMYSVRER